MPIAYPTYRKISYFQISYSQFNLLFPKIIKIFFTYATSIIKFAELKQIWKIVKQIIQKIRRQST